MKGCYQAYCSLFSLSLYIVAKVKFEQLLMGGLSSFLKFEHLVFGVSKLLEDPADRTLLRTFLLPRDRVDLSGWACYNNIPQSQPHKANDEARGRARRTAYEHFDLVAAFGRRDVRADELAVDVPRCACPSRGGIVERVDDAECVRVCALQGGELVAKENVGLGHVSVEKREARAVRRVAQSRIEQLVERRYARAAADERDVLVLVRCFVT